MGDDPYGLTTVSMNALCIEMSGRSNYFFYNLFFFFQAELILDGDGKTILQAY